MDQGQAKGQDQSPQVPAVGCLVLNMSNVALQGLEHFLRPSLLVFPFLVLSTSLGAPEEAHQGKPGWGHSMAIIPELMAGAMTLLSLAQVHPLLSCTESGSAVERRSHQARPHTL